MTARMLIRIALATVIASVLAAEPLSACSCAEPFEGLVEAARRAPTVFTARVRSFHAVEDSQWPAESPYVVVTVVEVLKGRLAGEQRLSGSGRGDCTIDVKELAIGDTFVFVVFENDVRSARPGATQAAYGLYGICGAVSARVDGDAIEGILRTAPRDQRKPSRMALAAFRRAILEKER